MIGETVGSYRIVQKLGEGGMGAVYVAQHTLLGRKAAIKVLLPALSTQPEVVHRFFNEARAVTSISDPGIVQVFDFGHHKDGSAFIVMELLEGEPLNVRMAQRGRLPVVEALRIGRQVAVSLATVHNHGIIHRDLKPENVFMVRDAEVAHGERAKILDFGIAKLSGAPGLGKTNAGALLGTPTYMSPEQCRGAGEVDHRSDIYALGCMLFHLVVGRPPFSGEGIGDVIVAHLCEPPPAPSSCLLGVPPVFDALVLRCLAKTPGERYASMGEVAATIDALLPQLVAAEQPTRMMPGAGATPPALPPLPTPPPRLGASPSQGSSPRAPSAPGSYPGSYPASYPGSYPASYPGGAASAPAPGSHPGTVALNLPTTLGLSSQVVTRPEAGRSARAGRWLGALAVVVVAAAGAGVLLVSQRGGASPQVAAPAAVEAAAGPAPAPRAAVSAAEGPGDAAAKAAAPATQAAPASAAPASAGPASAAPEGQGEAAAKAAPVAPAAAEALGASGDGVAPAAAAAKAAPAGEPPETTPAKDSTVRGKRQRRSRRDRGGCDRAIDTDCDGIPDVR
ncbi:MAG: serine/threonine protein kinase [Myxococcales bacterium]|nr:serine/threonine protein kinase [Myxococcales bacterium]